MDQEQRDRMWRIDCPGPSLCTSSGTSDATALVSGSAALLWAEHPGWTADQVLRVLINTAAGPSDGAGRNDYIGYGAVRPRVALEHPGDPGPAHVSPLRATGPATPSRTARPSGRSAPSSAAHAAVEGGGSGVDGALLRAVAGLAAVLSAVAVGVAFVRRGRAARRPRRPDRGRPPRT